MLKRCFTFLILNSTLGPSVLAATAQQDRVPISGRRYELLTGISHAQKSPRKMWNNRFSRRDYVFGKKPADFLKENYRVIPAGGRVLDIGMGEGRNAVFLASQGFDVTGVDISSVAVSKAKHLAKEHKVSLQTYVLKMEEFNPPKESFDAIICFYYVDRSLIAKMLTWLRPGGIIIFESHTAKQKQRQHQQTVSNFYLEEGELLRLFSGQKVLKFEEPQQLENFTSSIIIQKS